MSLRYDRPPRVLRSAILISCLWVGLLWLWLERDAATLIVAAGLALTAPALWDLVTARPAWLSLELGRLRWGSGRQTGEIVLAALEKVRFETRLDLSIRVRLCLLDGPRLTLPPDVVPPHPQLFDALTAQGVRCERSHFSLI